MLNEILLQGKRRLGLNVGIISYVRNEQYHVYAVESDYDAIRLKEGDVFDLANTYCRDVVVKRKTMTYDDVAEISEMLKHPVYLNTQLRAYIGTPIILNNQVWGTLDFSSREPKESCFTSADYRLIESMADTVVQYLSARQPNIPKA